MGRVPALRISWTACCAALLLGAATPVLDAQTPAAALVGSARTKLNQHRYDDAVMLIRLALEPQANATGAERLDALILLGIVQFYAGRDSLMRAAFREALVLDPLLEVAGLAQLDPELPEVLAAERQALLTERQALAAGQVQAGDTGLPPGPSPVAGGAGPGELYRCIPTCVGIQDPPQFVSMPRVEIPDHLAPRGALRLVMEAVVDTSGRVEPKSVRTAFTNAAGMERTFEQALRQARFRPGRLDGRPVRVLVELTFGGRLTGGVLALGRPSRL